MVFVGDFKQLPPVVPREKGEYSTIHRCCWWPSACKIQFTKNWRALENAEFINELELIGTGQLQHADIPEQSHCLEEDDLIHRVFHGNISDAANADCMILTLKVQDAMNMNAKILNMLPEPAYTSLASDVFPLDQHHLPSEYISGLAIPGAPNFELPLKIGARYMIIKNYAPGIVNGTLCKLISYSERIIHVQLLSGHKKHSVVMLPKCTFNIGPGVI